MKAIPRISNARPTKTFGGEIQIARGGIPAYENAWVSMRFYTKSPIILPIEDTERALYESARPPNEGFPQANAMKANPINAYRVRYLSTNLKPGPFSAPMVFALTRPKE